MSNYFEKLLKNDLTKKDWEQWLIDTPDEKQNMSLQYYIKNHLIDNQNKFSFPIDLNMTDSFIFFKAWLDYKDYMLFYATEYKEVYDEKDLSTVEQLEYFGFNDRQQEFIIQREQNPFYYCGTLNEEIYDDIMNSDIPIFLLILLHFTHIN